MSHTQVRYIVKLAFILKETNDKHQSRSPELQIRLHRADNVNQNTLGSPSAHATGKRY